MPSKFKGGVGLEYLRILDERWALVYRGERVGQAGGQFEQRQEQAKCVVGAGKKPVKGLMTCQRHPGTCHGVLDSRELLGFF